MLALVLRALVERLALARVARLVARFLVEVRVAFFAVVREAFLVVRRVALLVVRRFEAGRDADVRRFREPAVVLEPERRRDVVRVAARRGVRRVALRRVRLVRLVREVRGMETTPFVLGRVSSVRPAGCVRGPP